MAKKKTKVTENLPSKKSGKGRGNKEPKPKKQ